MPRPATERLNRRPDILCAHINKCPDASDQAKNDAKDCTGTTNRKHRKTDGDIPSSSMTGAVVGPLDVLLPRNFTARTMREYEKDLFGALLFSSIAFNVLDAEPMRRFLKK